jgi:anti-sigma factor RsiW
MSHISDDELQAFLDHELNDTQCSLVSEHLEACRACRARLGEFQSLFADIESMPEVPLHADLVSGVLSRLAPQSVISRRVRWFLLAELALGGGAMMAALRWLNLTLPAWTEGLGPTWQAWIHPEALAMWLRSLTAPVLDGLSTLGSFSTSATAPLSTALPVTGWVVILAGSLVVGLAANGLLLTRTIQPRRENRGSA